MLTFKAIHKLAPTYISELVSPKDTGGRYYLRSNNGKLLNIPPRKSVSMLGDRSFYMACMMKNASKASKVDPGDRVTLPVKFACKPELTLTHLLG